MARFTLLWMSGTFRRPSGDFQRVFRHCWKWHSYNAKTSRRLQIFVLLVCTWRHGGHVDGQEQKHFSPLGTKLYFHVNTSRKYSFVLTPNMAALSRGCKPRIPGVGRYDMWIKGTEWKMYYYKKERKEKVNVAQQRAYVTKKQGIF